MWGDVWWQRGKRLRQCETLGSDSGSQVVGSNVRALVLTCGTMPCTSCLSPAPRPSTLSTVCVCARAFPVHTMLGSVPTMQVPARVSPCQPSPESRVSCAPTTATLCAPHCRADVQSTLISRPRRVKGKTIAIFLPGAGAAGVCQEQGHPPESPRR